MSWRHLSICVALASIVSATHGCDPLADARYAGEPLLYVTGVVHDFSGDVFDTWELTGDLRLTVLWAQADATLEDLDDFEGFEQHAVTTTKFPTTFELRLYRPPPDEVMEDAVATYGYVIGVLAVYLDTDSDGEWTSVDRIVGGASDWIVIYEYGHYSVIDVEACTDELAEEVDGPLEVIIDVNNPTALLPDLDCDDQWEEWDLDECSDPDDLDDECPGVCDGEFDGYCELDYCCDVYDMEDEEF